MSLGERVRLLREKRGYSLSELAKQSHVSRSYLYQIESGESSPTQDKLLALASALGVTLTDLLGLESSQADIPDTLKKFAEDYNVPTADVEMLAGIQYRGRRPSSVEDWRLLYKVIRATIEDERV
jgi:transcriptional regulator with XRE-family HTH domain